MTRALIGTVMALALVGCATSVDDPVPAPEPQPPGKDPPAETFSGALRPPASQFQIVVQDTRTSNPPELAKQLPPNLPGR
jgi:hypothetical protein